MPLWGSPHVMVIAGILGALALVVALPVGRNLRRISESKRHAFESFAAGTSVAYVFLDVLVELTYLAREHVHVVLPLGPGPDQSLFAVVLVGLLVSYIVDAIADRRSPRARYKVHAVWQFANNALIGGMVVLEAKRGVLPLVLCVLAMGLHLAAIECRVQLAPGAGPVGPSRIVIALAPFLGALVDQRLPEAPLFVGLALVAGTTLVQVVHDELPSPRGCHLRAFVSGVSVYAALSMLRW
jgi:hypothetical protein